jgi:hypothetical protein
VNKYSLIVLFVDTHSLAYYSEELSKEEATDKARKWANMLDSQGHRMYRAHVCREIYPGLRMAA